jgi:hypothetical protein
VLNVQTVRLVSTKAVIAWNNNSDKNIISNQNIEEGFTMILSLKVNPLTDDRELTERSRSSS